MQTEPKLGRNPLRKIKRQARTEKSFIAAALENKRAPSAIEKIREMQIQVHWPELIQSTLDTRVGVQLKKLTRLFSRS